MRRPVKPFVTEYKGPNRRSSHTTSGQRAANEDLSSGTSDLEAAARPSGEAGPRISEDSYDAAMRAADALFAPAARSRQPQPASDRAGEALPDAVGGGRILRAVDEQPDPGLAALEVERAPRRRGRKPGSKNKIKAPSSDRETLAAQSVEVSPVPRAPAAVEGERGPMAESASPRLPSRPYRMRSRARFPWVRTKLRPGEEWKRRLPKVCW